MAQIIQFPTQDTAVAYIARDAISALDRPTKGSHIIEYDDLVNDTHKNDFVSPGIKGAPYSFRAYDITVLESMRLLAFYNELMAAR